MEQLKSILNIAMLLAIFGYCVSYIVEQILDWRSKRKSRYNAVCNVWAYVIDESGNQHFFNAKFQTKSAMYYSTFHLKAEAELLILHAFKETEVGIRDIVFVDKKDFDEKLSNFMRDKSVEVITRSTDD